MRCFKIFNNNPDDPNSLSHDYVRSIFEDSKGTLWIGTAEGLNSFNHQTEEFKRHQYQSENTEGIGFYGVDAIFEVMMGEYQGTPQSSDTSRFPAGLVIFIIIIIVGLGMPLHLMEDTQRICSFLQMPIEMKVKLMRVIFI